MSRDGAIDRLGRPPAALPAALAAAAAAALVWTAVFPAPVRFAGITIDRLSAVLACLVGFVGLVTFLFSVRYLDTEPGQNQFLRVLVLTTIAASGLMLSSNLLLLWAMWSATGLGLHLLLTHYHDRPQAHPPARKKFLISRLGDLLLLTAIALIGVRYGTLDLDQFLTVISRQPQPPHLIAFLIAMAAVTKSAQFPFHSWLPETMEAPTPVSALMHAGIINAGGAMILKFSPLMIRSEPALALLVVVGTTTVLLGTLAMWEQCNVKQTLAWSTVSQMGFMMVQCGLGVFPAAALHIVGHGLYKARAFLMAGTVPPNAPVARTESPAATIAVALAGTLAAIPAIAVAGRITGFNPGDSPGEMAMAAIVALSIGQVWVALWKYRRHGAGGLLRTILIAVTTSFAAAVLAFGLYHGTAIFLRPALATATPVSGTTARILAGIPVAALGLLVVIRPFLGTTADPGFVRGFRVHAMHGFYAGAVADLVVAKIWSILKKGESVNA